LRKSEQRTLSAGVTVRRERRWTSAGATPARELVRSTPEQAKQPYCFEVNDGELFAFTGIWERWKDPSGATIETCSILATTPNAVIAAGHGRMPVILDPDNYDLCLDPGMGAKGFSGCPFYPGVPQSFPME
jgi:putative SOS response-associated peptidase YedK